MNEITKGRSPFYPGQPVPLELFVGRESEISRIVERGLAQVENGKPTSFFIQGEYGIGKSSFAGYIRGLGEKRHALHGIYATLGGCNSLEDMAVSILEATIHSGTFSPDAQENIRNWLSKYIGQQQLFGISLNLDALKSDAPQITSPYGILSFIGEALIRLSDNGVKGMMLILDELNGIVGSDDFAIFIKGIIDTNAMREKPIPLMLVLCGVEERRRDMIAKHPPVDRIFEITEIGRLDKSSVEEFFISAFNSVQINVDSDALELLVYFSSGLPKIMHTIGDAAFWVNRDKTIDTGDANRAIKIAAEEIGKKHVDQQIYKAIQSKDYRSILNKVVNNFSGNACFRRNDLEKLLTNSEKNKLSNFLHKSKKLNILRSGPNRGEYEFSMSTMEHYYIWLRGRSEKTS